jgi:Fe-S-cluster containining protein
MPITAIVDIEADLEPFKTQINAIIKEAEEHNFVIPLPIIMDSRDFIGQCGLVLSQINCDACNGKCCRESNINLPIHLLNIDYERLKAVVPDKFLSYQEGHGISYPCFLLKDNKCSVYGERPFVCVLFPIDMSEIDMKKCIGLNSSCPESRRIARNIWLMRWRLHRSFNDIKKERNV